MFQSPRSGKFESNPLTGDNAEVSGGFNPLDRGNLNQISRKRQKKTLRLQSSFNPLDRGNLNQITKESVEEVAEDIASFQSPRSGKFESNSSSLLTIARTTRGRKFQSPRSGKFESNFGSQGTIK